MAPSVTLNQSARTIPSESCDFSTGLVACYRRSVRPLHVELLCEDITFAVLLGIHSLNMVLSELPEGRATILETPSIAYEATIEHHSLVHSTCTDLVFLL